MKLELRISNYDLLDEYLKRDIDIIGFGDEYCEWAIFNVPKLKEVVKKTLEAGKTVRVVTSFTTKECFENTVRLIEELGLISKEIEFVVNDYGVLQYLHKKEIDNKIIIGQMLNHSLEEYLWSDEIIKQESEKVKNSWLYSNFSNESVIEYFKEKYHIAGGIFNLLPFGKKSAEVMQRANMQVNFSDKYYTMAVSRKCHQGKFYEIKPGKDCQKCCKNPFVACLEKTYAIHDIAEKFSIPKSEVLYKVHNWVIYGNAIYHLYPENANLELELFRDNGVMIIQDRFYDSLEKIEEKIIEYKEV